MQSEEYLLPEEQQDLLLDITVRDEIERALDTKSTPFAEMIGRAKIEFVDAVQSLINADLYSRAGIETAKAAQANIKRYLDLIKWIREAISVGEAAEDQIANHSDPEQENTIDGLDPDHPLDA